MSKFAENTSVAPERTRLEIESVLRRYKADQFAYAWDDRLGKALISFRISNRLVRIMVAMPSQDDKSITHAKRRGYLVRRTPRQTEEAFTQAVRQRWRALLLVIKAKLEAVESQISTLEEEFLAWLVLEGGRTVGESVLPQLEAAGATELRLLPGPK